MSVFLEHLSMWNMLNCAEQVQIQKYETHAYKTLKTVGVQVIMLKHYQKKVLWACCWKTFNISKGSDWYIFQKKR